MELENTVYPLSRYWYSSNSRFYCAYGNTPAQDFLQNCSYEKEPEILVLGCGDICSCFYSLWKNFDVNGAAKFDGVHFVLNDVSAAVLARNILFLYLCLQMPEEENELKKWLSGMWAIWYCHELYPEHQKILNDALHVLCKYSDDWTNKENPVYPLVKFCSHSTLNEVTKIWMMWHQHKINVVSMHSSRKSNLFQLEASASSFVEDSTKVPFEEHHHDSNKSVAQKSEVLSYMEKGSVYAERVLGVKLSNAQPVINFTFYEREDGKYNLHYHSLPFRCFYQTVEFSRVSLKSVDPTKLLVGDTLWPMLANSVQQFSLWLQSAHKVLNSVLVQKHKISLTFDCSHALTFCFELENRNSTHLTKFDMIYTSNLMDHLCPPNLILSAIPLLKSSGLLFTSTLYSEHFSNLNEYLATSFGFDCKFIPAMLGVRCINHEGDKYASAVTVQPCSFIVKQSDFVCQEDLLIWEKLSSDTIPFIFSSGQQLPTAIVNALLNCVEVSVFPLIKAPYLPQMMNNLCVETAIKVFQVFMSNTCTNFTPQFWKPLCDAMRMTIKPYMYSMQTQLTLHGIHMHLTVTEEDCPICLQVPVSNHIGLFSTRSVLQTDTTPRSMAMAFVHKEDTDNAEHLCNTARNGGDVYIFDCISPSTGDDNFVQLYFYAPLALVQKEYNITSVNAGVGNLSSNITNGPTQLLSSLQTSFATFKFFQAPITDMSRCNRESFGVIASHISNGDASDLQIDCHSAVMSGAATEKLHTERVCSSEIKLFFGKFACQLKYPYPIAYDYVKIKVRRNEKAVLIHCPRAFHEFIEERPLYIISPDKEESLFPLSMKKDALSSLSGQQYTMKDFDSHNQKHSSLTGVKKSLLHFFQGEDCFFNLVQLEGNVTNVIGLVLVNRRLFNYEIRTPAVDLAFCFLEESFVDAVTPAWINISPQKVCSIDLNETEFTLFKEVFHYFAGRTNGTCNSACNSKTQFSHLFEQNIEHYFTRAVISLLLPDLDHYRQTITDKSTPFRNDVQTESSGVINGEKCDNCEKFHESVKKCSNCQKAKYCSKECHRAHWKIHKSGCKKPETDSDVVAKKEKATFQPFPIARYWHSGDFRFYYAFGNTRAEDFLQSCTTGVKEPKILSLGCGDIRSCFYSLWKHFDFSISDAPKHFSGVHFVLNDNSSPVQARNIIFLYLCLQLPQEIEERKQWLCAMWAIWYCHELHWQHNQVLDDSLRALLKYSNSLDEWASAGNPLQFLVKFTSLAVLAEISQTWKVWLERKVNVVSVEHMQFSRLNELKQRRVLDTLEMYAFSYSHHTTFIIGDSDVASGNFEGREVKSYIEKGSCYAENVLGLVLENLRTTVNLTLYEREDGVYTLHYGSMPFSGYFHTVKFSPDVMKSEGVQESLCDAMLVRSTSFKSLPLLSNSVQQFTMWVQAVNKVINKGNSTISFTFNNLHALTFCQELQLISSSHISGNVSQFDMIYTSNLMDHLGPPNIILSGMFLLKENGLLFSTTLLYKNFTDSVDEFISSCFGFDCKLLPLILGIRCINHEGADYASPVMIEPTPVDTGNMFKVKQHDRTLIWQNVSAQSFVFPRLPQLESGNITDGLFDSVKVSTFSLLTSSAEGQLILNNQCIETAVLVLQTFVSSVNSNDYHFWEPLSSALVHKLKPFLDSLQVQLFLHKLHMHLTVGKENCPMCNQCSIEEYAGLFCAEVPLPIKYMTPHFLALIHQYSSSDAHYLCNEAKSGKDVHAFDCFDGIVEDKTLKLKFFAPLKFVKEDYKVTIALSCMLPENNLISACLPTTRLKDKQIKFVQYSFIHTAPVHQAVNSKWNSFGELTSHIGDGNRMHSEIRLSDSVSKALVHHKLGTDRISSHEIKISCGKYHYFLNFKYPINYDGVIIKFSKLQGTVKITSPRRAHQFTEETPILIMSPDHQLSLPPQHVKNEIMVCHSGLQKTKKEQQISNSVNRNHALMTPLINVKETFMFFFQCEEPRFSLVSPQKNILGIVIVNQCLFDYQYRAPAMDLAFYFMDPFSANDVLRALINTGGSTRIREIIVDDAENELLRKALVYFAKRTNGNFQTACKPNRYEELCRHKVDQHFTRAIVYLLYNDPDHQGLNMMSNSKKLEPSIAEIIHTPKVVPVGNPSIDEKCDYCDKYFLVTKKCTRCRKVQYCSKDCQTKHWQTHSNDCKVAAQEKDKPCTQLKVNIGASTTSEACEEVNTKCSFCNKTPDSLKKCLRCGEAQYCGKECQAKHWPRHKIQCQAPYRSTQQKSSTMQATCTQQKLSSAQHQDYSLAAAANTSAPRLSEGSRLESCAYCGTCSRELKACAKCGKTKYCGKECQRKHWNDHKVTC